MKSKIKISFKKTVNQLKQSLPIIFGVILLVTLLQTFVPITIYTNLFSGHFWDPLVGSLLGSIAAGNPITSYIIGGELLKNNVSLIAVTAFIVAWTTVGIVQLPAESLMLGKKFALTRNILAFISSIIVAVLTVFLLNIFNV